jgi:hypothetical protein
VIMPSEWRKAKHVSAGQQKGLAAKRRRRRKMEKTKAAGWDGSSVESQPTPGADYRMSTVPLSAALRQA